MKINTKNPVAAIIAVEVITAFIIFLGIVCFVDINTDNDKYILIGFTALINLATGAFGYYLGTSKSSAIKSERLAELDNNPSPPVKSPATGGAPALPDAVKQETADPNE